MPTKQKPFRAVDSIDPLYKTTRVPIEVLRWSNSQDEAFRRCPLKWYRSSVLGLRPNVTKSYFLKGRAIHAAIQALYAEPPKNRDLELALRMFDAVLDQAGYADNSDYKHDLESGNKALKAYWAEYDRDEGLPAAEIELPIQVELPGVGKDYVGKVDIYFGSKDPPALMEIKTGAYASADDFVSYNVQAARYVWALSQMGHEVDTIIVQIVKTPKSLRSDIGLERYYLRPTKKEIAWAVHDLAMMVNEVQREDKLIYPVYGQDCRGRCDYHDVCLTSKLGGDAAAVLEENFTVRVEDGRDNNETTEEGGNN